jgi:hypothetical protein
VLASLIGEIVFELLPWPAAALWPRLTRRAADHGPALKALIWTCAVLIIAGVYVLAVAVLVGAVLLITGAV